MVVAKKVSDDQYSWTYDNQCKKKEKKDAATMTSMKSALTFLFDNLQ